LNCMQLNIRYIADVEEQNDLEGKKSTNGEQPIPNHDEKEVL